MDLDNYHPMLSIICKNDIHVHVFFFFLLLLIKVFWDALYLQFLEK